jgi:hypothetical protein
MPEAAAPPPGPGQLRDDFKVDPRHRRDHQLRDPIAAPDDDRLLAEIDGDDRDLAPVVGIDRAGRIEQPQTLAQRQTAARPHLPFETVRNRDRESGRNQGALARLQGQLPVDAGAQIESGAPRCGGGGRQQILVARRSGDGDAQRPVVVNGLTSEVQIGLFDA